MHINLIINGNYEKKKKTINCCLFVKYIIFLKKIVNI